MEPWDLARRKFYRRKKPVEAAPACPACGKNDPALYVYGPMSAASTKRAATGEIIAGGLCEDITRAPKYRCRDCGESFGHAFSRRLSLDQLRR